MHWYSLGSSVLRSWCFDIDPPAFLACSTGHNKNLLCYTDIHEFVFC